MGPTPTLYRISAAVVVQAPALQRCHISWRPVKPTHIITSHPVPQLVRFHAGKLNAASLAVLSVGASRSVVPSLNGQSGPHAAGSPRMDKVCSQSRSRLVGA